jgi:integrase
MSTHSTRIPSYRCHKPSGLAVVTLGGTDHYLGRHGSLESKAEYERLIAEHLANRQPRAINPSGFPEISVAEMILAVWKQAENHYCHSDGTPTRELDNLRHALRPLRNLYGHTRAIDFGPLALRGIREKLMQTGLCRTTINARINRIRRVFRWATSLELIPVTVAQALATMPGLQRGRCAAPESPGVKPVPWADVEATLPHLSPTVAAMVQVMRFSNCRAAEVVRMRSCDLRMDGEVWMFRPQSHKNAWRGHDRLIYLGPQVQSILRPFLKPDLQSFLFSPGDALENHHARRRAQRQSKRTPSELCRQRKNKVRWLPRPRYDVNTFQQAVRRACRRAGVPGWSVLQVRHTRATEVRERYGLEGAAAALGHRRVETTQIYAERNERLSRSIAQEIG